jgi:Protein of unknown function (DUF3343)
MMRLLLTFPTLHQVLAAEKALRLSGDELLRCRPTPTPPGLGELGSICGMSVELLNPQGKENAMALLTSRQIKPSGAFELPN